MLFRFRVDYTLTNLVDNASVFKSDEVEARSKTQATHKVHDSVKHYMPDCLVDVHRVVVLDQNKWDLWINVHAIEAVRNDRTA